MLLKTEVGWFAAKIECLICMHQQIAVYPASCDESKLECSNCGAQRSEVIEYGGSKEPS